MPSVPCARCAKTFHVPPSRIGKAITLTCSTACAGAMKAGAANPSYRPEAWRPCPVCGLDFHVNPSWETLGRGKYCSRACYQQHRAAPVTRTCAECRKSFQVSASTAARQRADWCSRRCWAIATSGQNSPFWKGTAITVPCLQCGQEIKTYRPILDRGRSQFCSRTCKAVWMSAHNAAEYTRGRGGKRPDLGGLYVRSRWEANWARYLNLLIDRGEVSTWEYEPTTFSFEGVAGAPLAYTPDFLVTYPDGRSEYQEVKGWMDERSARKLLRMGRYHPSVCVTIIDEAVYLDVARREHVGIATWEHDPLHPIR